MNLACRPLTDREMRDLMAQLGWDLHFHTGERTMYSFNKHVEGITVACKLVFKHERWVFTFTHMPGVQTFAVMSSHEASFPHPKFSRWERLFFRYARACEAVAADPLT